MARLASVEVAPHLAQAVLAATPVAAQVTPARAEVASRAADARQRPVQALNIATWPLTVAKLLLRVRPPVELANPVTTQQEYASHLPAVPTLAAQQVKPFVIQPPQYYAVWIALLVRDVISLDGRGMLL